MYGIRSKNIDLALNKKMVAIFFVSYPREAESKNSVCKCDIYINLRKSIDAGNLEEKEAMLVKNCRRARARKPGNQLSLALLSGFIPPKR